MARRNWMPRGIGKREKLLNHLDENLKLYQDELEIADTDLDNLHNCNLMYSYILKNCRNITSFMKALNSYFNDLNENTGGTKATPPPILTAFGMQPELVNPNIFGFIRKLRRRLMAHPNYTESIGMALLFYGAEINFNKDKYKPTIKVIVRGKKIKIITSIIDVKNHEVKMKIGKSKTWVSWRRMGSATMEFEIPINTKNMGIPVQIILMGLINDKEIGHFSDVVEILYKS